MPKATRSFKQFVFGFLGWFLFANIAFLVIVGLIINAQESINGVLFLLVFLWAPTAAMLIVLALGKKLAPGSESWSPLLSTRSALSGL